MNSSYKFVYSQERNLVCLFRKLAENVEHKSLFLNIEGPEKDVLLTFFVILNHKGTDLVKLFEWLVHGRSPMIPQAGVRDNTLNLLFVA